MFDLFKKKRAELATNGLFVVTVNVARGTNTEMPAHLVGAYVPVYAAAADHELAAKAAVTRLVSQGFELIDLHGPIQQIDPRRWSDYVQGTWPEIVSHFPSQQDVLAGLASGTVFTGPFISYEDAA